MCNRKTVSKVICILIAAALILTTGMQQRTSARADERDGTITGADYRPDSNPYRNVIYYGDWSVWEGEDNFYPSGIPADKLTHLNFAFMDFDANGNLIFCDKDADTASDLGTKEVEWGAPNGGILCGFQELRANYPNLRIGVSLGGWSKSGDFSKMTASASARKNFVDSVLKFVKYTNMDFVDIDWEYPGANQYREPDLVDNANDEGTLYACAEDKENYIKLLRDLREGLDKQGTEIGKVYELSVALPAAPSKLDDGIDVKALFELVDFANLMTYDLRGAWDETSGHQACLYHNPNDPMDFSVDNSVNYLLSQGAPSEKIVIGCAFYTRGWEKVSAGPDASLPGLFGTAEECTKNADQSPSRGAANEAPLKVGDGGGAAGSWSYRSLDKLKAAYPGLKEYWDDTAKAAYYYDPAGGAFFTFDDPRSIKAKTDYVKTNHLGGIISWMASQDKPTAKGSVRDELTTCIYEGLFGNTPITQYKISACPIDVSVSLSTYKEQWEEGEGYKIVLKNNAARNDSGDVLRTLEESGETIKNPKVYITTKSGATFTSGGYDSMTITKDGNVCIVDLADNYETEMIGQGVSYTLQLKSDKAVDISDITCIELSQRITKSGPEISRQVIYGNSSTDPIDPTETPKPTETPDPTETPEPTETPATEDTYDNTKVYNGGDMVVYKGITYRAKWWTQGVAPDPNNEWGPWEKIK